MYDPTRRAVFSPATPFSLKAFVDPFAPLEIHEEDRTSFHLHNDRPSPPVSFGGEEIPDRLGFAPLDTETSDELFFFFKFFSPPGSGFFSRRAFTPLS